MDTFRSPELLDFTEDDVTDMEPVPNFEIELEIVVVPDVVVELPERAERAPPSAWLASSLLFLFRSASRVRSE